MCLPSIVITIVLSLSMTYHLVSIKEQRVSHREQKLLIHLEARSSSPDFSGLLFARSLVFYVVFCRYFFSFFLLAIALPVLRFTDFFFPHLFLLAFLILNTAFRSRRKGCMTVSYDLEGSCKPIQTSLRPPLFIEVPVFSQNSE